MPSRTRLALVLTVAFLLAACSSAVATRIFELWRSPFGCAWSVSVDEAGNTCWAATGASVVRLSATGDVLSRPNVFWTPQSVSANQHDDSCWVADTYGGQVAHLDENGQAVLAVTGFSLPQSVSVNPADDSVWVADTGHNAVVHLDENGTVLHRVTNLAVPVCVSANDRDDSCWVAERGRWDAGLQQYVGSAVSHISGAGVVLWRGGSLNGPSSVSVDTYDGSCWVADTHNDEVVHLSETGSELRRLGGYSKPRGVSADRMHSSCWVADTGNDRVVQLASDYTQRSVTTDCYQPRSVSAVPSFSSCWVADTENCEIVFLDRSGSERARAGWFYLPQSVSTPAEGGDCWAADWGLEGAPADHLHAGVERVTKSGLRRWRTEGFTHPAWVSVHPTALNSWVADYGAGEAVGLGSGGGEYRSVTDLMNPVCVSVSPYDSSVWIASQDGTAGRVQHLNSTGYSLGLCDTMGSPRAVAARPNDTTAWVGAQLELGRLDLHCEILQRGGNLSWPWCLSINSADSSVWIADGGSVVHLSEGLGELARRVGFHQAASVSVNSVDGSCWVADQGDLTWETGTIPHYIIYLNANGNEVCRDHRYFFPSSVAVCEDDGTCWVADTGNGQIVHVMAADFIDVPPYYWAHREIGACLNAGIVTGYDDGTYRPEVPVDRAAMAVYISRALAGGDGNVPDASQYPIPSFTDVPNTHWAYRYVEYAAAQQIVAGYADGTYRPTAPVDRASMAVFVARAVVAPSERPDLPGYTPPSTPTFSDVGTSFWAYKFVEYVADPTRAIAGGYPDGTYRPAVVCTRAQMAVYVTRAFHLPTSE